jgi:hypothetical protein
MGKSSSAPPPPDYKGAAEASAAGNRVNQVTPYGSLTYTESGTDSQGNPRYTANVELSADQRKLLEQQNATSLGLGNLQQQGLGYVQNMLAKPFDTSGLPQTGINAGEQMSESIMRRLQPNIQMEQKQFDAQMANQGIPLGSEAYSNAKRMFDERQNDKLTSAIIQGTQTGLAANQQGFGQLGYIRNEPINTLSAIRSGSQVTNPNFVTTPAGPDYMGAAQSGYNAQLANSNAQNAASSGFTGGLMQLGGTLGAAAMMNPAVFASDIRLKENIKAVGYLPNGLPVYEYEFKPEFKHIGGEGKHIGVMAQEVEKVMPEAVLEHPDGYKMVNYGALQ